ncbi:hypothetical protein SDC9_00255 [bioreactor metagenome]|uniref:Novel STAND NTPase 1 domain-containing protein n=1 Tax=bioreactor metagenome TaxID=1076179 RepID=A0A644SJD7_9ZZZZ
MTKEEKISQLNKVFSPFSPVEEKNLFQGRIQQLEKIVDTINEEGQHCILYGERGVGKTSLSNIMMKSFTAIHAVKVTCNREDTFFTLWRQSLKAIQFSTNNKGIGFKPQDSHSIINLWQQFSDRETLNPSDIVDFFKKISHIKIMFIFDEFDNVHDDKTRKEFADLIKSLSDNIKNVTVILVGIAENIESLIGDHQSLERCLRQVKMPRMSEKELSDIIRKGIVELNIAMDKSIEKRIIDFASGFPHYVHLLCKYGILELIENGRNEFSESYLKIAIRKGIDNTGEQLKTSFRKAIHTANSSTKWKNLIFSCANAKLDEFNSFSISNAVKEYNKLTGKKVDGSGIIYNLNKLVTDDRGAIFVKIGKGATVRYYFRNPMMRPFVKLKMNSEEIL